jgi:hypothetical protein
VATWSRAGVGNLLVVLCRSNVAESLSTPTEVHTQSVSLHQITHSYLQCLTTFVLKECKNRNSFKIIICFYLIKNSIFFMRSYTVFQFTQCSIENRYTCNAWRTCCRLPTPGLGSIVDHSDSETVVSNPTWGRDVCPSVSVLCCPVSNKKPYQIP